MSTTAETEKTVYIPGMRTSEGVAASTGDYCRRQPDANDEQKEMSMNGPVTVTLIPRILLSPASIGQSGMERGSTENDPALDQGGGSGGGGGGEGEGGRERGGRGKGGDEAP